MDSLGEVQRWADSPEDGLQLCFPLLFQLELFLDDPHHPGHVCHRPFPLRDLPALILFFLLQED